MLRLRDFLIGRHPSFLFPANWKQKKIEFSHIENCRKVTFQVRFLEKVFLVQAISFSRPTFHTSKWNFDWKQWNGTGHPLQINWTKKKIISRKSFQRPQNPVIHWCRNNDLNFIVQIEKKKKNLHQIHTQFFREYENFSILGGSLKNLKNIKTMCETIGDLIKRMKEANKPFLI